MSTPRKAVLGRGLGALIPSVETRTQESESATTPPRTRPYHIEDRVRQLGRVADIDVDDVRPNPYQPRLAFDDEALDELAASIEQLGVIQPITVRIADEGHYEIISGERRLRAARRAGLRRIPAYVREAGTEEMLEMAIVENVQREELNPIEVALGYQRLIDECTLTQEAVAQKVGKNRATVANMLRLLRLPPKVQAALRDGTLSAGHARALLSLDDEAEQIRLLAEIEQKDLSVREVEDRVRAIMRQAKRPATEAKPTDEEPRVSERDALQLRTYTDRLRARFSTQVHIRHRPGAGGRIEIAYYSDDDLERLMEALSAMA